MIHADNAIELFRKSFDEAGLQYTLHDSSEKKVQLTVTRGNVSVNVWFDVGKQLFGFDMIQGGSKTYDNFGDFEEFFGTYLSIYTVFLPKANRVADALEAEMGWNSVYDSFYGNKQQGYTAKFRILGAGNQLLLVNRIPEGYMVRIAVPDDDNKSLKIRGEYKYEINDAGEVVNIPTISSYVNRLQARYKDAKNVQIQRIGEYSFCFSVEDLVITADVEFLYMEVKYKVKEVNDFEAALEFTPADPYDLSQLYMSCKDFHDDAVAAEEDDDGGEDAEKVVPEDEPDAGVYQDSFESGFSAETAEAMQQEEEDFSGGKTAEFPDSWGADGVEDAPVPEEQAIEEPAEEEPTDVGVVDDADGDEPIEGEQEEDVPPDEQETVTVSDTDTAAEADTDEPAEEGEQSVHEDNENTNMVVESIKIAVKDDGERAGVQFIVDGSPYLFSVEDVQRAGIPVKRIKETVRMISKCGISMTEDEVRLKRYADELDNPQEMLEKIAQCFFA